MSEFRGIDTSKNVQAILKEYNLAPKYRLGQNFLVDGNILRFIVASGEIEPNDVVLEVGCGTGSLTRLIAEQATSVVVAELDPDMIRITKDSLSGCKFVNFVEGDILESKHVINKDVIEALTSSLGENGKIAIIANLPYTIATPFIINMLKTKLPIRTMILTIQKELADRLAAPPKTGTYGGASVNTQLRSSIKTIKTLSPHVFFPPPKVQSAIVHITPRSGVAGTSDIPECLDEVLRSTFGKRRKTLRHSITKALGDSKAAIELLKTVGIEENQRPETLTPKQFYELAKNWR